MPDAGRKSQERDALPRFAPAGRGSTGRQGQTGAGHPVPGFCWVLKNIMPYDNIPL